MGRPGPAGGVGSVLVVEDDPNERERMAAWLEREGLEVMTCPGPMYPEYGCVGARAGRCPLADAADVVVLDLWLGSDAAIQGVSGRRLLRHYLAWGKPVLAFVHGRDRGRLPLEDVGVLDWPPERRELVESVLASLPR